MKRCTKCGVEKDESEFYTCKRDGLLHRCKVCISEASKDWRSRNEKRVAENKQRWAEANKEKVILTKKAYVDRNKEKVEQRQRNWASVNSEKVRASRIRWKKENPEKVKASREKWNKANPEKVVRKVAYQNLKATLGFKPPEELVLLKQQQYLINKELKNAKHQQPSE